MKRMGYAIALGLALATMGNVGTGQAADRTLQKPTLAPGGAGGAIAQRVGTCRTTVAQIAVYEQPNTISTVVGTIPAEGVMMLGDGRGEGWIQILEPQVGWVDTRFLIGDDSTPCPPGFSYTEPAANFPAPMPAPGAAASTPAPGTTRCQVVPPLGLIVRNQPVISERTYVATIPTGAQDFEFADMTRTTVTPEGRRTWIYITAPYEGWISTGFVGSGSNLVGVSCP
ncbi:SH3 domain-containing protein [Leptolyngbya sp. CCY15150]|uniref:SH3 domain-containing protein n=1 Tax=Leptolyngbya sp. CCY15150 TaxID=2767772 RepID=UPI0019525368|nr:SH3 domain-containing protein [Leptolyngbya sp. CCY15150]